MKTNLLIMCVLTMVLAVPASADEREELMERLRAIHERMHELEERDREVPHELVLAEREIEEALEELEERRELEELGDAAIEIVQRISEPQAQRLRELRRHDPEEFFEILEEIFPWLEEMEDLRREDPERYELERQSARLLFECEHLAEAVREAEGDAKKQAKEELRRNLRELFEVRLRTRRLEVKRLEAELAKIRKQVENMSSKKDEMIERRLEKMISADEEW